MLAHNPKVEGYSGTLGVYTLMIGFGRGVSNPLGSHSGSLRVLTFPFKRKN